MKITLEKKLKISKKLIVIPVFEENYIFEGLPKELNDFIKNLVKNKHFLTEKIKNFYTFEPFNIFLISLGKEKDFKNNDARKVGGKIGKFIKSKEIEDFSLYIPKNLKDMMPELIQGIEMIQYNMAKYKTKKDKKKTDPEFEIKSINFINENASSNYKDQLKNALIIAESAEFVKDLVNGPSNIIDADYLVNEARKIAKENKYKILILGEKELKKMNWGGVLAVNKGSKKEAKAIVLEYDGAKNKKDKPIIIVGKGMIFDTGGYNLKPTGYMETMMQDMAGAGTVLGVFYALKNLGIKKNVIAVLPIAENLINAEAYKPSDIITMLSGDRVEITNTDAEGRLILADGITYANQLKAKEIITIATLTGAVEVALGKRYAGLITNKDEIAMALKNAGEKVGELAWQLPMHEDFRKSVDSDIADFKNCDTSDRGAGTAKAAAFLEKFVGDTDWCHIDIGGTAFTTDPEEFQAKGATAHGLRLLLEYLGE